MVPPAFWRLPVVLRFVVPVVVFVPELKKLEGFCRKLDPLSDAPLLAEPALPPPPLRPVVPDPVVVVPCAFAAVVHVVRPRMAHPIRVSSVFQFRMAYSWSRGGEGVYSITSEIDRHNPHS